MAKYLAINYLVFSIPIFWVYALLGFQHDTFSLIAALIFIGIFFVFRKREKINSILRGIID